MPLCPPAPIIRTGKTKFANRRNADIRPSATIATSETTNNKTASRHAGFKIFLTSFTITAAALLVWGVALHFAAAVLSGQAQLQATLSQYATVLKWMTAA